MKKNNSLKSMSITVGGSGMIPRLNQIAPIKKPFTVSIDDLNLILRTPSLTVKMVSPIDGHKITINRKNYQGMIKLYTAWVAEKDHLDTMAEAEALEKKADEVPMTPEEKKDLEFAKKQGYVPANSQTITKSQAREAVDNAFKAIIDEPTVIEPVKSQVKDLSEVLKK